MCRGQRTLLPNMNNDFILILPNIRSCHNVGAMFRTADAFAVDKLILAGYTAAPPKVQIDKVALGAEQWIPFEKIELDSLRAKILDLKSEGYTIVALEKSESSIELADFVPTGPVALIVGHEVSGVEEEILDVCDEVVHIEMLGKKESLNVSIAAGIAMREIRNKLSS